ncbi:hypothetical protein [Chlamydia sp.]|uniref:hypothetical protein n=1 Tax=Chlamydia sp. TaxID=35827 RepID=UPI0025BBB41C|nr:hypothetical protein [Chlamydia sp.]MBQ8498456.1 hypothetical protein [Chlamydia sp.]
MKKQEKIHLRELLQYLLFFFAFLPMPRAEAHSFPPPSIQKKILSSHPGDYAVLSRGVQKIFLLIRQKSPEATWVEISEFPSLMQQEKALTEQLSWKKAFQQLRSQKRVYLLRISKHSHTIFVLKNAQWTALQNKDSLPVFVKILQLPLTPAPLHLIKYKGKERTPWYPKTSLNGESVIIPSSAWVSVWPEDSFLLSGKHILMYFSNDESLPFPLWTSIDTPKGAIIFKTIEIGHQATSPHPTLPDF